MSKTVSASSSPVFFRQDIPTTAKQNRLRRIKKRKYNSEKYFARRMRKSSCKIQNRITSTGETCSNMRRAYPVVLYANSIGGHKQFFGRTYEPFK